MVYNFPLQTNAGTTSLSSDLSIAGASVGDPVLVGLPSTPTAGVFFDGYVSAPNTVKVRCNHFAAGIDPSEQTFKIKVFKVS